MKMIKYISSFLFFFLCFMLYSDNVFAIPATGGFSCTYDIKFENVTFEDEHNDLVISYGTYEGSNGKEGFNRAIVTSSKTVNPNFSLSYYINHPSSAGSFDLTRVDVAKFYDSKNNKWVCPKVRYTVFKTGDANSPYRFTLYAAEGAKDIKDYQSDVETATAIGASYGEVEASVKKVMDPSTDANSGNNGTTKANVISCNPVISEEGVEIVMEINRDTNVATFTIDGQKANTISNYTAGCKDPMDEHIKYCKYKYSANGDHSKDIVAFDKPCPEYALENGLNYEDYDQHSTKLGDKKTTDANGDTIDVTGSEGGAQLEHLTWEILGEDVDLGCDDKDVKALMEDITRYYRLIEVLIPVLIILLGSIDLTKGVLNQDRDSMQKVIQAFIKRCIAGLAIYFLPLIIETILSLPGLPDSNQILCGIAMIFR